MLRKLAAAFSVAGFCMTGVASAASPLSLGAELGASYDSNAGNAHTRNDTRETGRIDAGVNAAYAVPFGSFTALQLRAALDGEADTGLGGLSFGRASTRLRLLNKPGVGFYAPVLAVWTSGDWRQSDSDLRTGAEWRAGVYLSEPVTTQISARAAFNWSRRDSVSRVFDGQVRGYELSLDWAVLPQLSLYGEYRIEKGPIVVTADGSGVITPKSEHLRLQKAADAIELDEAFGDDWWAFRVHARTGIATLGANLPLTRDISLDAQLRRAHATVAYYGGGTPYGSPGYDRWLGGVSLLLRF